MQDGCRGGEQPVALCKHSRIAGAQRGKLRHGMGGDTGSSGSPL